MMAWRDDGWNDDMAEAEALPRGTRIIGWCVFPAGAEAREVKNKKPIMSPDAPPYWEYHGIMQNVTHWRYLPNPPSEGE